MVAGHSSSAAAPMLSSSPAASSPPTTTTTTTSRPSRLRRLSNLRTALHTDSSSSKSSRPLFYRSGSTPETRSRTNLHREPAAGGPESPSISRTASPFPELPSDIPQASIGATLERVQSPATTPSSPTNRRRSQTTSSLQSTPGLNALSTSADPPQSVEMVRAATAEGLDTAATASTSLPARPATSSRKDASSMPSIRFVPFQDTRSTRPSLSFQTVSRTLPRNESIVRVGRYSEKETASHSYTHAEMTANPDGPSDAPVGFKSKVVSRRHCEFSWRDSSWWIKDVKSSSGTFLNHIRLSQPGQESKPFRVKDGDIVQLGIDFKGGEEAIFRCVKIRILCNRGWQRELNSFNTSAHKQLRKLATAPATAEGSPAQSTECTICLSSIAPCQSLFIAPCSHTWHYKCIRPIILTEYPAFLCPNCRAVADLEEDIEEPESWDAESAGNNGDVQTEAEPSSAGAGAAAASTAAENADPTARSHASPILEEDDAPGAEAEGSAHHDQYSDLDATQLSLHDHDHENTTTPTTTSTSHPPTAPSAPAATSAAIPIPGIPPQHTMTNPIEQEIQVGESAAGQSVRINLPSRALQQIMEQQEVGEGVMTPRNDIGPFAF